MTLKVYKKEDSIEAFKWNGKDRDMLLDVLLVSRGYFKVGLNLEDNSLLVKPKNGNEVSIPVDGYFTITVPSIVGRRPYLTAYTPEEFADEFECVKETKVTGFSEIEEASKLVEAAKAIEGTLKQEEEALENSGSYSVDDSTQEEEELDEEAFEQGEEALERLDATERAEEEA